MASEHVNAYPKKEQYERWQEEAEERGYDDVNSQFIRDMIEAGLKKFDTSIAPDESNRELRRQRNDLKRELDRARERIDELERQLHEGERETITTFLAENPGATFDEIVQHLINTVPERVNYHLDELEGEAVRVEDGQYYPVEGGGE